MYTVEKIYRFFVVLGAYAGYAAVVLLPLGLIIKPIRKWCGLIVVLMSPLWFIGIWLMCAITVYLLWHGVGIIIGFLLFGIGMIPLAALALLFDGHFSDIGYLVLALVVASVFAGIGSMMTESR